MDMTDESLFKPKLPLPLEKAIQLRKDFGDKAIDVVREMYNFGSANNLREELMYLNSVEGELSFFDLNVFVRRMEKLGITVTFSLNSPWVYLDSVNNKKVKERKLANHGYTIGFRNKYFKFVDERGLFELIRRYCNEK